MLRKCSGSRDLIRRRKRFGKDLVYGWTDCDRLAFIIKARAAGLSVREVMPIIEGLEPAARIVSIKAARRQCLELIDQLDRRHQILRAALTELRYLDSQLSKAGGPVRDRDPLGPQ
jgi:DNA-binding transcriptional MerR regulator